MKPRIPGSALACSDAIGRKRPWIAEVFHKHLGVVETWCRDQVTGDLHDQDNSGRPNPTDNFLTLVKECEHPHTLKCFVAEQWKCLFVPLDKELIASPTLLVEAADALARDHHARRPKLTASQVHDARDRVIAQAAAIADQLLKRLGAAR